MQVRALIWTYIGKEHCLWTGKMDGLLSHIQFFITPTGRDPEEYFIRTDTNGIPNETCIGLEDTKKKAQDLLNSYAIGMMFQ